MCGIIGIVSRRPVAIEIYEGLLHLQHRGQDSAGILTSDGQDLYLKRGRGLAGEVFGQKDFSTLAGTIGIGHLRYPTRGKNSLIEAQPLTTDDPCKIGLVHNGNIVNYPALRKYLEQENCSIESQSDSELILKYFAHALAKKNIKNNSEACFSIFCEVLTALFSQAQGAYSIIILIAGIGMLAFRDPHGLRPLVMGERKVQEAKGNYLSDYAFASENILFDSLGFESQKDVAPGELVFIDLEGKIYRKIIQEKEFKPCLFEYVYFARPDSVINHLSVYQTRVHMGENLAKAWKKRYPDITPDVVVPVPCTSNTPAIAFANELKIRYAEGLYKNSFIGRTFIMPSQDQRIKSVRIKFHPELTELKNKKVLLLDDSIVRGTTSIEIINMVKEAGAKEIYLVSACPPVKFPCYYGINIPTAEELIANQYSPENLLAKALGVDVLLYQTEEDLKEAILRDQASSNPSSPTCSKNPIKNLCMACLNGQYFCGEPA